MANRGSFEKCDGNLLDLPCTRLVLAQESGSSLFGHVKLLSGKNTTCIRNTGNIMLLFRRKLICRKEPLLWDRVLQNVTADLSLSFPVFCCRHLVGCVDRLYGGELVRCMSRVLEKKRKSRRVGNINDHLCCTKRLDVHNRQVHAVASPIKPTPLDFRGIHVR